MWLLLLLGGAAGMWLFREPVGARAAARGSWFSVLGSSLADPRWLFVPWALYTLFTAMLFHTELRYRLPLYPVLLPYAALALARITRWRAQGSIRSNVQIIGAMVTVAALVGMTWLHRDYAAESVMLARKHWQLAQAARALSAGDAQGAQLAASAALALDPESALARVALARAALAQGDRPAALAQLDAAIGALRAQPYAHLLKGALLREAGDRASAAAEFAYEASSRDDLQRWSWDAFASFITIPASVPVGAADLGLAGAGRTTARRCGWRAWAATWRLS
jgi:tetratricopeptide (TPR) repeat protein